MRVTMRDVHDAIGIAPSTPGYGVAFGPKSREAFRKRLTNLKATAISDADIVALASSLGADPRILRAVRKVEAPRGAFDDSGIPTMLYERHVFARNTEPAHRFDGQAPTLSGGPYGRGGYGAYSGQIDKLMGAMALDPHAALEACSWGAFQVLGENWQGMEYASPLAMVLALTESEYAHLDSFARFVKMKGLQDELRACRPGDPDSCIPFVRAYNGSGFRQFDYHTKLAATAARS